MAKASAAADKTQVFAWEGTDKRGKRVKGESRTASLAMAKAELRRQGINPIKVRKKATSFLANRKQKITSKDIAIFSRQMATMTVSYTHLRAHET